MPRVPKRTPLTAIQPGVFHPDYAQPQYEPSNARVHFAISEAARRYALMGWWVCMSSCAWV